MHHSRCGDGGGTLLAALLAACVLAAFVISKSPHRSRHPVAKAVPEPVPRPVVTHITVQHVTSHPLLSGWEIVALVAIVVCGAAAVAINAGLRNTEGT